MLDILQAGGRPDFSTHTAAFALTRVFEDARARRLPVHAVLLDIRKAYDTVARPIGKEIALRRMGIPEDVIAWFIELDRCNRNTVRTIWRTEAPSSADREPGEFEARRGFAQGAAEAPLLWLIFYDMVIAALKAAGVGRSVYLASNGVDGVWVPLLAYMDDLALLSRTTVEMTVSLNATQNILRVVGLEVEPTKSVHMGIEWLDAVDAQWLVGDEAWRQAGCMVSMGGLEIPRVDHDVGTRYLGVRVDGAGRWSDQLVGQEKALQQALMDMGRARIPPSLAKYIWRSVLTPKALFPFAVASPPWEELASLELRTWKRFAPLFGLRQPMPLALALGDPAMGGWGLEGWIETLSKTRARLADHWAHHPSAWVRQLWFSARWGSFLCQSVSGGAQPWLGRESPEWAPTAPNGEHPWAGRSAQLWAQGAVGLLDGWDLCRASEGPMALQHGLGHDPQARTDDHLVGHRANLHGPPGAYALVARVCW
jgi:hypothetical protein